MIGKRIFNCKRIGELAQKRKAIYHVRWGRAVSASWFLGMPLHTILGYIRMGWIYEYKPKKIY
jgi:hypothetical protein